MKKTFLIISAIVLIVYDICVQNVIEASTSTLGTAENATVSVIRSVATGAGQPSATPTQKYPENYARMLRNTFKRRRPWRGSPYYSVRRFRGGTSVDRMYNVAYETPTPNYNPRVDGGYTQYQYAQSQQQPQQPQESYQTQYQQQAPLYNQPQQQQQTRGAYPTDYQQYPPNYQYSPYSPQQQYQQQQQQQQQQQYPQQPQYTQQSAYQQYLQSQYSQAQDPPNQQQMSGQQPPYPPVQQQQQQGTAYQNQPYHETQQQYQHPQYQQPYPQYQQPQEYNYQQQPPSANQQYPQRDDVPSNYLPYTAQHYIPPSGNLGDTPVFYSQYPPGRVAEDSYMRKNLSSEYYPYINPFYRVPVRRKFRSRGGRSLRPFFSYNPPTIPRQIKDGEQWHTGPLSESIVTQLSYTYKNLIDKFSGPNYLKQVKEKAKSEQILHIHTGANFTRTTTMPTTMAVTTLKT